MQMLSHSSETGNTPETAVQSQEPDRKLDDLSEFGICDSRRASFQLPPSPVGSRAKLLERRARHQNQEGTARRLSAVAGAFIGEKGLLPSTTELEKASSPEVSLHGSEEAEPNEALAVSPCDSVSAAQYGRKRGTKFGVHVPKLTQEDNDANDETRATGRERMKNRINALTAKIREGERVLTISRRASQCEGINVDSNAIQPLARLVPDEDDDAPGSCSDSSSSSDSGARDEDESWSTLVGRRPSRGRGSTNGSRRRSSSCPTPDLSNDDNAISEDMHSPDSKIVLERRCKELEETIAGLECENEMLRQRLPPVMERAAEWQWATSTTASGWKQFDQSYAVEDMLEAAFENGMPKFMLMNPVTKHSMEINFETMRQTDLDNGKWRSVRRQVKRKGALRRAKSGGKSGLDVKAKRRKSKHVNWSAAMEHRMNDQLSEDSDASNYLTQAENIIESLMEEIEVLACSKETASPPKKIKRREENLALSPTHGVLRTIEEEEDDDEDPMTDTSSYMVELKGAIDGFLGSSNTRRKSLNDFQIKVSVPDTISECDECDDFAPELSFSESISVTLSSSLRSWGGNRERSDDASAIKQPEIEPIAALDSSDQRIVPESSDFMSLSSTFTGLSSTLSSWTSTQNRSEPSADTATAEPSKLAKIVQIGHMTKEARNRLRRTGIPVSRSSVASHAPGT